MTSIDTITDDLRARVQGPVTTADDAGWDDARRAFNLVLDQRPVAVAEPESVTDVQAVLAAARDGGARVAPQLTGHGAAPLGDLSDTILLRTSGLRGVEIDPGARRARVAAGEVWGDVVGPVAEHGLAALHGSSPTVGVVGYTLGGGMGWLARRHGLAANRVTAVDAVTADGTALRADQGSEPELFWALRGGGGGFAVVTAIEFELLPVETLYAGVLFFPFERAAEVLHAWREWSKAVPDEVTSIGRLLQFPPIPDLPDMLRGKSFAVVEAALMEDEAEASERLRPLRELGPEIDTFRVMPPTGLRELHMDPPAPVPGVTGHQMLADLPPEALDALLEVTGPGSGSPLLSVEIRHAGGALARSGPEHGALDTIRGEYALFGVGAAMSPELAEAHRDRFERVHAAVEPHASGRPFFNMDDGRDGAERLFEEGARDRLRAVKAQYDPDGLLRANHELATAAA